MKKRYTSRKSHRGPRRYKRKARSNRPARKLLKAANTYVKKKYTRVFTMTPLAATDVFLATVSLIGGKNNLDPLNTATVFDVNLDTQLETDMKLYLFFKISGVAIKYIFPMPTSVDNTPVQWVSCYSASDVLAPRLPTLRALTLAAYLTSSCDSSKPISRYYNTAAALKRFGISYCSTDEYDDFNTSSALYGGQLLADQGSSVNIKVFRASAPAGPTLFPIGRVLLTYYVTYKGNKGESSLTTV